MYWQDILARVSAVHSRLQAAGDVDLTKIDVECALADAVRAIAEWNVPNFGCSDCECHSHLFGMRENPIHHRGFMNVIEDFRMNKLDALVK